VADVEFVQFHPTALHHPSMPRPLLSEALRGHGALLRDANGERFVDELLPRDEVSRAMTRRMLDLDVEHCWLDATGLGQFDERFPTISVALREVGLDPAVDWLPIAPAAHNLCGGVVTDLEGASSLPHLWAAGEVACSGVHGANRLASNSLLEGMVFGFRVVEAIDRGVAKPSATGAMRSVFASEAGGTPSPTEIGGSTVDGWVPCAWTGSAAGASPPVAAAEARHQLQRAMTKGAGVLRSADSLAETAAVMADIARQIDDGDDDPARCEVRNLVEVALGTLAAAGAREESRGAHTRSDFPLSDPQLRTRLVLSRQDRG
jgi:L-aspartate oxidase